MESPNQFDDMVTENELFEESVAPECEEKGVNLPETEQPSYKPYVGMEFDSLHQAFLFYNEYAAIIGFSVRKDKTRKSNIDGAYLFRRFCCSKEGYPRNSREMVLKQGMGVKVEVRIPPVPRIRRRAKIEMKKRAEVLQKMRVGCNAKLDVKRGTDGKWVVQKFVEEHNHECVSLGDAHLLRSHRGRLVTHGQGGEVGENASADELRTLEEVKSLKPSVGMEFESHHKAFLFYNAYARVLGFVVRKDKTRKSNIDGSLLFRRFCCSKEGYRRKHGENEVKERKQQFRGGVVVTVKQRILPVTRVGCNAKLEVKKITGGKWVVQKFIEEHNHEFDRLGDALLHRYQNDVQSGQGQLVAAASDGGTGKKRIMCSEAGNSEKSVFGGSRFRNRINKKRRKKLEKGDTQVIFNYFTQMQTENSSFFYAVQVDEDDQILSCFWADARSKLDFGYFGDVIFLETSYGISHYGRPFVPIVGVNHHLQTVVFGCAILLSETEESFTWLLETLLKAMCGQRPITVITDQDEEMAKAIERVLPGTYHCLSLWHILQNTAKHLSYLYNDEIDFGSDFKRCIHEPQSSDDFESRWASLVDQYQLRDNEWLDNIYGKRHKWVPVYSKHIFQADMMTTQRTETLHSFFNNYLNKSLHLNEFVSQYEKALVDSREKEAYEDFASHQTRHVLKSNLPLEKQAADDYTRSVFREFHKEFIDSFNYIAVESETLESNRTFVVSKWGQNRNCIVNFNSCDNDMHISCSCQYFEFMGVVCRHILKVFTATNAILAPEAYLKKRWTKRAKCGVVLNDITNEKQADCHNSIASRYIDLCQLALNLSAKGSISVKTYQIAKSNIRMKLREIEGGEEDTDISQFDVEGIRCSHLPVVVIENSANSEHLVGQDSQMLSAVSQVAFCDSPRDRTRDRPSKRIPLTECERSKRVRTGPESCDGFIPSHSGRVGQEPNDPCDVEGVGVQETENHRLLNMYPNICMYACPPGTSGDLNDEYNPSDAPSFGEPFAGLSCIQTSEPNIFDLNQDVTVGHSLLPHSQTSHLDLNEVNHVARPPDSWILPSSGWIKLNFGGTSKEICMGSTSRRIAGFGGTLSVSDGSVIKAYAGQAGEVQAVYAEFLALWNGLKILSSLPSSSVWIEGDSQLVIKWLKRENINPWSESDISCWFTPLFFEMESIMSRLSLGRITHITKERNSMAGKLANEGLTKDSITIWDQLPSL